MSRSRTTNAFAYGKFIGLFHEELKYMWLGIVVIKRLNIYII